MDKNKRESMRERAGCRTANVDASVAFRNWKEGKDNKYKEIIAKQVCSNLSEY